MRLGRPSKWYTQIQDFAPRGVIASTSLKRRVPYQPEIAVETPIRGARASASLIPPLHVESGSILAAVETCDRLRCGCSVAAARPPPLLKSKPYRPSLPARDRSERRPERQAGPTVRRTAIRVRLRSAPRRGYPGGHPRPPIFAAVPTWCRHAAERRPQSVPISLKNLAGGLGFEPRLAESESAVLPLDDPPPGSFGRRGDSTAGRDWVGRAKPRRSRAFGLPGLCATMPPAGERKKLDREHSAAGPRFCRSRRPGPRGRVGQPGRRAAPLRGDLCRARSRHQ